MFEDLHIFVLTVGEPVTVKCLWALKERTPEPYKLTIWYDACGRGVNWDLYKTFLTYTDDVVLLNIDHGSPRAVGYALLYLDGKWIMLVPADTVVEPGYMDKFKFALKKVERVACIGCARIDNYPDLVLNWDFVVNNRNFIPDGIIVFSKDAVNDLGSIATAFCGYGMEQREWCERAIAKGWNAVACTGIMKEIGTTHDGRNMNSNLQTEIPQAIGTYLNISDHRHKNPNWWDNRWRKKMESANA